MDPFDNNFSTEDPAAEFLAHEREQLKGLEDDIPGIGVLAQPPIVSPPLDDPSQMSGSSSDTASPLNKGTKEKREEPEVIKKWKMEQVERLKIKDCEEAKAKDALQEQAKKELDEWYKQHAEKLAKLQAANRAASESSERDYQATTHQIQPGTEWDRVAKLCDFNPKTARNCKDVSRLRSVILQLKAGQAQTTT